MDPPYNQGAGTQGSEVLAGLGLADAHTLIIAEADEKTDFTYLDALNMECVRRKEYKTNVHMFIRKIQE